MIVFASEEGLPAEQAVIEEQSESGDQTAEADKEPEAQESGVEVESEEETTDIKKATEEAAEVTEGPVDERETFLDEESGILFAVTGDLTEDGLEQVCVIGLQENRPEEDETYGQFYLPEKVTFNDKEYVVAGIEKDAFKENEGLKKLVIPRTVIWIDEDAFGDTAAFEIICEKDSYAEEFLKEHNISYITESEGKEKVSEKKIQRRMGENVTESENALNAANVSESYEYETVWEKNGQSYIQVVEITKYTGTDKVVTIPGEIDGLPVRCIGHDAFYNNQTLQEVMIPESVQAIRKSAFSCCGSLKEVKFLGNSIDQIEQWSFLACNSLIKVDIPASVSQIDPAAYRSCINLEAINVDASNTVYTSVDGVLYNKDKTKLISYPDGKKDETYRILDGATEVSSGAFDYEISYLKTLILPSTMKNLNNEYLFWDYFEGIEVDSGNPYYSSDKGVLYDKNKKELLRYPLGNNKKSYMVPKSHSYTIPDGVTTIGRMAFQYQYTYTYVAGTDFQGEQSDLVIPASVTKIDDSAFDSFKSDYWRVNVKKGSYADTYFKSKEFWDGKIVYDVGSSNVYEVTCNANGGKIGTAATAKISVTNGKTYGKLPSPKRSGYIFQGWYTQKSGGTKVTSSTKVSLKSKQTLYAHWKEGYTITYELNGGKNNSGNPSVYKKTDKTITLKNPSRKGYSFVAWYTSSSYKTKVTTIPKGSTGNKKLYAKWKKLTYKITYDKKGGTISGKYATTYTVTDTVSLPKPYRRGYTFTGWSTGSESNITKIAKGSTGNKSYTAKWKLNTYQITYNLSGGTNNSKNPKSYTITTPAITLQNPSKKGYKFAGWYKEPTYKTRIKTIAKGTTGGIDVFAKWQAKDYSIVYEKNGGTGSMSKTSCKYGKSYSLRANTFKKTGYHFAGWAKSAKGAVVYSDKKTVSNLTSTDGGAVHLYAKWSPNVYNVKFYNGDKKASGSTASMKCKYNTSYSLTANAFKKTGYHFTGWAKSEGGKVVYKNKASIKNLSSTNGAVIKLYAVWEVNPYTVKFHGNSATKGKMSDMKCVYGKKYTLQANAFSNGAYKFAGWATSAEGNVKYKNKETVSNLTDSNNKSVTLYAQWSYTVEYKSSESVTGNTANTTLYKGVKGKLAENGFTHLNKTFTGWNTKKDGSGSMYTAGQTIGDLTPNSKGVVTLYAQWGDTYHMPVDINQGVWTAGTYDGHGSSTGESYQKYATDWNRTDGMDEGMPVYAVTDGTISWRDDSSGSIGIRHSKELTLVSGKIYPGNSWQTWYGHMTGLTKTKGQQVKAGEIIGYVGSVGNSSGPHLHFAIGVFEGAAYWPSIPISPYWVSGAFRNMTYTGDDYGVTINSDAGMPQP